MRRPTAGSHDICPVHRHALRAEPDEVGAFLRVHLELLVVTALDGEARDHVEHLAHRPERPVRRFIVLHDDVVVGAIPLAIWTPARSPHTRRVRC